MSKVLEHVERRGSWLLAHMLAALTIAISAYMIVLNVMYLGTDAVLSLTVAERLFILVGVPAVFAFWGWMLTDFFRNRPKHGSVLWGWFLLLGSWLAAILYFFLVWRPRYAHRVIGCSSGG